MFRIVESLSKTTRISKKAPIPKAKNLNPALRVVKIYKVEIMFAVVNVYPSPVKCITVKQTIPAHVAVALPNALSRLLAKLNHP